MEVIGGAEQRMEEFVSFLSPTKESNTAALQVKDQDINIKMINLISFSCGISKP